MEISQIVEELECQAEWRRGKADEFPDDERNLEAAEDLERLAKEISGLEKSDIAQRLDKLWEVASEKNLVPHRAYEWFNEKLLGIGFRTHFETGSGLLERYCNELEDDLRCELDDEAISVLGPTEDDLIDRDEVVKAAERAVHTAKMAYTAAEKAYREARAQARARLFDSVRAKS
jgi:hypothetical protein